LLIGKRIKEVLPLDDAERLRTAAPSTSGERLSLDPAQVRARNDAQVQAVLGRGKCGLIVLGGAHNLADSVRRLGGGNCEYLRVTTRRYRQSAE
jgi:hypothetical protein